MHRFRKNAANKLPKFWKLLRGPETHLLAFLALEGLKLLECLGIYTWPEDERKRLLEDISGLAAGKLAAEPGRSAQG